jgi:hypothetical protein
MINAVAFPGSKLTLFTTRFKNKKKLNTVIEKHHSLLLLQNKLSRLSLIINVSFAYY